LISRRRKKEINIFSNKVEDSRYRSLNAKRPAETRRIKVVLFTGKHFFKRESGKIKDAVFLYVAAFFGLEAIKLVVKGG